MEIVEKALVPLLTLTLNALYSSNLFIFQSNFHFKIIFSSKKYEKNANKPIMDGPLYSIQTVFILHNEFCYTNAEWKNIKKCQHFDLFEHIFFDELWHAIRS